MLWIFRPAADATPSHRGEKGEDHACRDEQQADDFVPADGVAQIESREADGEDHLDLPDDPYQRGGGGREAGVRSEEHTSELQSLMRSSYTVTCLKQQNLHKQIN